MGCGVSRFDTTVGLGGGGASGCHPFSHVNRNNAPVSVEDNVSSKKLLAIDGEGEDDAKDGKEEIVEDDIGRQESFTQSLSFKVYCLESTNNNNNNNNNNGDHSNAEKNMTSKHEGFGDHHRKHEGDVDHHKIHDDHVHHHKKHEEDVDHHKKHDGHVHHHKKQEGDSESVKGSSGTRPGIKGWIGKGIKTIFRTS